MIIVAYKNWNETLKYYDIPDDWKVFVITKEYFNLLYGPTLFKLVQFYTETDF